MVRNACYLALFAVAVLLFGADGAFAHSNHHHTPPQTESYHLTPAAAVAVDVVASVDNVASVGVMSEQPASPACPLQHCPDCGSCCGCGASGGAALSQFTPFAYPQAGGEKRIIVPARVDAPQPADDLSRPPKFFA